MKNLRLALISLLSVTLASAAEAASVPEAPNVTLILPAASELASAYPEAARGRNVGGYVLLFCTIRTDDSVDCHVGRWGPAGYGFENAAMQLAAKLRVSSNDAKSYASSRFNLPLHFPADPPNSTSGPPTPTFGAVEAGLDNMHAPLATHP